MTRRCVTGVHLELALLLTSAAVLSAQESSVVLPVGTRPPDAAANAIMPSKSIPTTAGEPFSGTSVALLTETRQGCRIDDFSDIVARLGMSKTRLRAIRPTGNHLFDNSFFYLLLK